MFDVFPGYSLKGLLAADFSLVVPRVSWLTTTESPTESPLRIWMFTPSLMPVLTGRGAALPSMLTHTRLPLGFLPSARFLKDLGGMGGKSPFLKSPFGKLPAKTLSPNSPCGGRMPLGGSAIGVPSAGVNLRAFTGIAMASVISWVTMVQVAVMPGSSFCSGFSAVITTVYVTTLLVVVGFKRTSCTEPLKVSFWKASTVNVTRCPCFT